MAREVPQAWPRLARSVRWHVLAGALALTVLSLMPGLGISLPQALGFFVLLWVGLWRLLPSHLPIPDFGWGNRITLARVLLLCLLAGLLGQAGQGSWFMVGAGAVFLVLDGLDGYAARRSHTATPFGARFDMETDALFMLVAAALVWDMGKAPSWVLLSGLLRYGFVAAGMLWPRLAQPLPPRRRRGVLAMINAGILTGCFAPIIAPSVASFAAALGLSMLLLSFALDLRYLLRARPG